MPLRNLLENEGKTPTMSDWIEFICAEALLDEPTECPWDETDPMFYEMHDDAMDF